MSKTIAEAYYLIQKSREASNSVATDMSGLKLHLLLYFGQGCFSLERGRPLFDEPMEAWDHTPVARSVYDHFKKTLGTTGLSSETSFDSLPDSKIQTWCDELGKTYTMFLDKFFDVYGTEPIRKLSATAMNHKPWLEAHANPVDKNIYPKDIQNYFAALHRAHLDVVDQP